MEERRSDQEHWIDKYKVFRRIALIWAMFVITDVIYIVFHDVSSITASVAAALGTVVGLMATVVAFYQHSRHKEDTHKRHIALEKFAYRDIFDEGSDHDTHIDDH